MGGAPGKRTGRRRPGTPRSGGRGLLVGLLALAGLAAVADAGRAESLRPADPDGRLARPALDDRWRARGMAFVDLPLGFRARYEAQALHRLGPGRELAAAALLEPAEDGRRLGTRLLESRFALTRAVASHVEIELAWSARSPLSMVDLLRIEDQRLAAMIRFVP